MCLFVSQRVTLATPDPGFQLSSPAVRYRHQTNDVAQGGGARHNRGIKGLGMALRIGGSGTSANGLERARRQAQAALEKLSSGLRINRAADDAAGLAISENLKAAERAFNQGQRNLSDGISVARVAEGALGQQAELVSRMRELAVQAGNGALDDGAKNAIRQEFNTLRDEVDRISNATEFNGRKLLNGDIEGPNSIKLRDGTGSSDVIQISISDRRRLGSALLGSPTNAFALMGDILLRQSPGDPETPEIWYRKAIDYARDQKTKMWELRATTRLARLWRSQGRTEEARDLLAPMFGWFTEGFDTDDLLEAKALLDELS